MVDEISLFDVTQWRALQRLYHMSDERRVLDFLRSHPKLGALLVQAMARVRRLFGAGCEVELSVVRDPEDDGPERLFGYILTDEPVGEALAKLDVLDDEWLLDAIQASGGIFNLNLRFR